MADSGDEKKHVPTQRRRQKARSEGQFAQSQDLTSAVLLLTALASLWLFGGRAAAQLAIAITDGLSSASIVSLTTEDATHTLVQSGTHLAVAVVPLMIAMMAVGVLINITQTGFLLLPSKIAPSLENISPATGLKRIVSLAATARLGFGVLKIAVVVAVTYAAIRHFGAQIMHLAGAEIPQVAKTLFDSLMGTCTWIAAALFVLALLDYGFQWFKHERDLMMTDEELREEMKETEGDQAIADQRKQNQRTSVIRRSETKVMSADVVITGPSGIAIALQYNPMTMAAPMVVAKGKGQAAESIVNVAHRNGIMVVDRPLLAEHQFRMSVVGTEIAADQYQAVSQVLRMLPKMRQAA